MAGDDEARCEYRNRKRRRKQMAGEERAEDDTVVERYTREAEDSRHKEERQGRGSDGRAQGKQTKQEGKGNPRGFAARLLRHAVHELQYCCRCFV